MQFYVLIAVLIVSLMVYKIWTEKNNQIGGSSAYPFSSAGPWLWPPLWPYEWPYVWPPANQLGYPIRWMGRLILPVSNSMMQRDKDLRSH